MLEQTAEDLFLLLHVMSEKQFTVADLASVKFRDS